MSPYITIAEAVAAKVAPGAVVESSTTEASFPIGKLGLVRVVRAAPANIRFEAGRIAAEITGVRTADADAAADLITLLADVLELE